MGDSCLLYPKPLTLTLVKFRVEAFEFRTEGFGVQV